MPSNKLIVLAGPTAVGKTSIAIELAKTINCTILSADSRQLFKELTIGSAAPTLTEQQGIKHYFVADRSVNDPFSAGDFSKEALEILSDNGNANKHFIVCGGSGLYIKALIEGFDEMPDIDELTRNKINKQFKINGINWLQRQVEELDPEYFQIVDRQNPQRLIRALEVCYTTGNTFTSYRKKTKTQHQILDAFDVHYFVLDLPREILYDRINHRVDIMIKSGLVEEAKSVYSLKHLNALQTVGYKELFDFFEDKYSLDVSIELIKQNTRRFAKRQLTWFRKQSATWIDAQNQDKAVKEMMKLSGLA